MGKDHGGCRTGPGHGPPTSVLCGRFHRFAAIDGRIEHSPAEFVRRPKVDWESTTLGLERMELSAFIAQGAAAGPVDHALACLLGLRISEACGIDIEDLSTERGHRTLTVLGKGAKLAILPMRPGWPGRWTLLPASACSARC